MKRSLKNLTDFSIEAVDGTNGKVKDFLFDEETWIVKYVDADFGSLFKDKRVLIPGIFINSPDWEEKKFPVKLTKESIEDCPAPDDVRTVSREYEEIMSKHYNYYWPWAYSIPPGTGLYYPSRPLSIPSGIIDEKDMETSLRSLREVYGYTITALDGKIGHIEDLIVDDIDWQIVYVITDTSNWLPWSKKVVLAINWLKEISFSKKEIFMELNTDIIKNAPEFNPEHLLSRDYEKELAEYYNRSMLNTRL